MFTFVFVMALFHAYHYAHICSAIEQYAQVIANIHYLVGRRVISHLDCARVDVAMSAGDWWKRSQHNGE